MQRGAHFRDLFGSIFEDNVPFEKSMKLDPKSRKNFFCSDRTQILIGLKATKPGVTSQFDRKSIKQIVKKFWVNPDQNLCFTKETLCNPIEM